MSKARTWFTKETTENGVAATGLELSTTDLRIMNRAVRLIVDDAECRVSDSPVAGFVRMKYKPGLSANDLFDMWFDQH